MSDCAWSLGLVPGIAPRIDLSQGIAPGMSAQTDPGIAIAEVAPWTDTTIVRALKVSVG